MINNSIYRVREQEAQIPIYREKWKKILLSTERIDRQRATDAVTAAYQWFDYEAPEIIFVDSPYEAFKKIDNSWLEYLNFSLLWDLSNHLLLYHQYEYKVYNSTVAHQRKWFFRT